MVGSDNGNENSELGDVETNIPQKKVKKVLKNSSFKSK